MDNGFNKAQYEYDNQEPPDDRSEAFIEYTERLTTLEQQKLCLEYMEAKRLFTDYEDWRTEEHWTGSWIDGLQRFCESDDDFFDWLDESHLIEDGPQDAYDREGDR